MCAHHLAPDCPSGATESNNLALKGVAHFYKAKKKHLITAQTEHKCVLDSARFLEQEGFEVTYLPVKPSGLVDLEVCARVGELVDRCPRRRVSQPGCGVHYPVVMTLS